MGGDNAMPLSLAVIRAQVEHNENAFRHPIPGDLWAELKEERLLREDAPVPS